MAALTAAPEEAPSDRRRLEALCRSEVDTVWRLLRRLGVPPGQLEDAAQEVFAVAARRIADVLPGRERSFVCGVALRVARGARRDQAVRLARYEPLEDDAPAQSASPERLLGERRALELLDRVLGSLEPRARAVFVLFELEGFTLDEIAELLEIPRGTAASRLRRARAEFLDASRREQARRAREP